MFFAYFASVHGITLWLQLSNLIKDAMNEIRRKQNLLV